MEHERQPLWVRAPIKNVAVRAHLYTEVEEGEEVDRFERWIAREYEQPGLEAAERAISGGRMRREDWKRLARYFALQDLRTPQSFLEWKERFAEIVPDVVRDLEDELRGLAAAGGRLPIASNEGGTRRAAGSPIRARVVQDEADVESVPILIEGVAARKQWLDEVRRLLSKTATVLLNLKWAIAEASESEDFLTSDHPTIRLNYEGPGRYDLEGGWAREKGNLVLPLSPRVALFAEIGSDLPDRMRLSGHMTRAFQTWVAKRAHRLIFSLAPLEKVPRLWPRRVDRAVAMSEKLQWSDWHGAQTRAESSLEEDD